MKIKLLGTASPIPTGLRAPMSKLKEATLLQAHRAGCEFANRTGATLQDAKRQAQLSFAAEDEQDVFIAGFHGELKRLANQNRLTDT